VSHTFDKQFWERHWRESGGAEHGPAGGQPPNPYLAAETADLAPGTALDAGCGTGAEALWLAGHGWAVTAVDISSAALARAGERARTSGVAPRVAWVEADLSVWDPGTQFDLVTTHYAHPALPQLQFYARVAAWVAPGGTLLIVGHLPHGDAGDEAGRAHHPPAEASATAAAISAGLDGDDWDVVTAQEGQRTVAGRALPLYDVVVRATRRR
jgi:SAM-dependent methyltransferase